MDKSAILFQLVWGAQVGHGQGKLVFLQAVPRYVEGIYIEHSPGRGDPMFTQDNSAFDVFVTSITPTGESAFIAIEMKYSETMTEPPAKLRSRYDELSAMSSVFRDSAAPALRDVPLQQLWREHMLSRAMVENGGYGQGRFVVIHPAQNAHCEFATRAYQRQLVSTDPTETGFQSVTLEECLSVLSTIGEDSTAAALHKRYLDFDKVDAAIFKD